MKVHSHSMTFSNWEVMRAETLRCLNILARGRGFRSQLTRCYYVMSVDRLNSNYSALLGSHKWSYAETAALLFSIFFPSLINIWFFPLWACPSGTYLDYWVHPQTLNFLMWEFFYSVPSNKVWSCHCDAANYHSMLWTSTYLHVSVYVTPVRATGKHVLSVEDVAIIF